jgi:hypothetical protein
MREGVHLLTGCVVVFIVVAQCAVVVADLQRRTKPCMTPAPRSGVMQDLRLNH